VELVDHMDEVLRKALALENEANFSGSRRCPMKNLSFSRRTNLRRMSCALIDGDALRLNKKCLTIRGY